MKSEKQRQLVIITGSPKSGINLIKKALSVLGLKSLETLDKQGNIHTSETINRKLLKELGLKPYSDINLPANWEKTNAAKTAGKQIREMLATTIDSTGSTIMTGDPCIVYLLPVWKKVINVFNFHVSYINIERHPWEVARSIEESIGLNLEIGHKLWLRSCMAFLDYKIKSPYSLISYDRLINEPVAALKKVEQDLKIEYSIKLDQYIPVELLELFNPGLKNHNVENIPEDEQHAYRVFSKLYLMTLKDKNNLDIGNTFYMPALMKQDLVTLIRTIHHLSCTGGSVICKCLAAMHNIVLLSEIHPLNPGHVWFTPIDPLQQLQVFYPNISYHSEGELKNIFKERLSKVVEKCRQHSKELIIRDHSHTDYLANGVSSYNCLLDTVAEDYDVKSVITIRNPIDSYLSLMDNVNHIGWQTDVKDFDHYCSRFLAFLDRYQFADLFLYEDFVQNPDQVLEEICKCLIISYNPAYKAIFPKIRMTGDSGRGKEFDEIKMLPRREITEDFLDEIERSSNFKLIVERFGYC